jgi:hypothetical protein
MMSMHIFGQPVISPNMFYFGYYNYIIKSIILFINFDYFNLIFYFKYIYIFIFFNLLLYPIWYPHPHPHLHPYKTLVSSPSTPSPSNSRWNGGSVSWSIVRQAEVRPRNAGRGTPPWEPRMPPIYLAQAPAGWYHSQVLSLSLTRTHTHSSSLLAFVQSKLMEAFTFEKLVEVNSRKVHFLRSKHAKSI